MGGGGNQPCVYLTYTPLPILINQQHHQLSNAENEWGSFCYLMGDLRGAEEAFARSLELDPGTFTRLCWGCVRV